MLCHDLNKEGGIYVYIYLILFTAEINMVKQLYSNKNEKPQQCHIVNYC